MTIGTDTLLGPQKVHLVLDAILPEHAHRAASHAWLRFWTTSAGAFNVRVENTRPTGASHHEIRFVEESRGWDVRVPCTASGLDAVILAMLAANALDVTVLRKMHDDTRNALSGPLLALRSGMIEMVLGR